MAEQSDGPWHRRLTERTAEPDLDLRRVRYFAEVAEQGHFGRAAAALRIAQPSLSRQVQLLERQIGARLFDRTPGGARLTEAGEAFLRRGRTLLLVAEQAAAEARAAAQPNRITVGYATNLVVTPAVRELRRRHPEAEVRTLHLGWDEPRSALLQRQVDVAVARLPFPRDDLRVRVLHQEQRVVIVPRGHRLAGADSVSIDDLADEPMPRMVDPEWNAFWRVDPRPDGRPAPPGPMIAALEDKLELIAGGQVVCLAPAAVDAGSLRPDLTTVPVHDIPPAQVALATRPGECSPLVSAFTRCSSTPASSTTSATRPAPVNAIVKLSTQHSLG